jgi:hypothetical protein
MKTKDNDEDRVLVWTYFGMKVHPKHKLARHQDERDTLIVMLIKPVSLAQCSQANLD